MKTVFTMTALFVALVTTGFSKAYFQSESEMVEKATAIAMVQLSEPHPSEMKGSTWTYKQTASAKVIQILKGKLPDTFTLYGGESFICAKCTLGAGRYLVFLRQDGDLWAGSNWHLSIRPFKDEQIEWFVQSDQLHPLKFQPMDEVLSRIRMILSSSSKSTYEPTKSEQD